MNFEEIKAIQASMAADEVVVDAFSDADVESLKIVIRIALEVATGLTAIRDAENLEEEARYHLDTVISGVEWFTRLSDHYGCLTIYKPSQLAWGRLDASSLFQKIDEIVMEFLAASGFSDRCRKLLDLYKIELALVGILYPS